MFAIPASAAQHAQDEVIPLVELEKVRLPEALRQFARKARLNVILDPRLSAPPFNEMTVSVRWENVTAKEALLALLENYGLVMVETGNLKDLGRTQIQTCRAYGAGTSATS